MAMLAGQPDVAYRRHTFHERRIFHQGRAAIAPLRRSNRAAHFLLRCVALLFSVSIAAASTTSVQVLVPAHAATAAQGGINVEPSARPWRYVGANPDSW